MARHRGSQLEAREISAREAIPEGWWSAGLGQKPVAITHLFLALLVQIIQPLAGS
jgi:hypothetical protein